MGKNATNEKENTSVILDKEIDSYDNDFIGIEEHINCIKQAINSGAEIISLSSGYGGGKSSLCKILSLDNSFDKTSCISLWDVIIDKQEKNSNTLEKKDYNPLNLYKSFLYQLSADFNGARYSNYVNKALNKTTTFFNIYFKSKGVIFLIITFILFLLVYFLSLGIDFTWEFPFLGVDVLVNQNIISYFSLFVMGLSVFFMILNGKTLYTSWKTERDRLITSDDVTALYVDLIKDSIKLHQITHKKNLVIIEDVDRCIDDSTVTNDNVLSFLKGLLKLKHYKCSDFFLKRKLKSVVFIIAINEAKLYGNNGTSNDKDELLKLFDYRVDLGKIHNEDFNYVLDELLKKIKIPEGYNSSAFKIILRSKHNSIRLLKCVINDALLKYNSLVKKFDPSKAKIKLDSCIAYSYLKNNYFNEFENFFGDDNNAVKEINEALNNLKIGKPAIAKIDNEFKSELAFFIENKYIDDDFKQYFYNYPKGEKYTTIQESILKQYLFDGGELNIENNRKVDKEFIIKMQKHINDLGLEYPLNILDDGYISNILFELDFDEKLLNCLKANLKLDTVENQENSIMTINKLSSFCESKQRIKEYIYRIYKEQWIINTILVYGDDFYSFRYLLTDFLNHDIVEVSKLFSGSAESIRVNEFELLNDKSNVSKIINMSIFSEDLEIIFPKLIDTYDLKKHIEFAKYWSKNIKHEKYFVDYILKLLKKSKTYNYDLLNLLRPYYNSMSDKKKLCRYLNSFISTMNNDELRRFNDLHYFIELTEDNIDKFLRNNLYMTPLISWLYYNKFDNVIKGNIKFDPYFSNLASYSEYSYLDKKVKAFKKYLLNIDFNDNFDYLFFGKFVDKYSIDINWAEVNNVHLLFIKNDSNVDTIIKNIESKNHESNLVYLLDEISNYCRTSSYETNRVLVFVKFIEKYSSSIKGELEEKTERTIDSIYNQKMMAKATMFYQIKMNKVINDHFYIISRYGELEDKQKYAAFLNQLEKPPALDIILAIDFAYPFNENIIKVLMDNKYYKEVIEDSILSNSNLYLDDSIAAIDINSLINIYKNKEVYKKTLIKNSTFLSRIYNYSSTFLQLEDILESLNSDMTVDLLNFVFKKLSDESILRILESIDNIPKSCEEIFVENICEKTNLIKEHIDIINRLKVYLSKTGKMRITKEINKLKTAKV